MEKRSWPRKASRFNADLQIAADQYPCVVRDFSQTGVLASLGEDVLTRLRRRAPGETPAGRLLLNLPSGVITISVELARVTDQGAGLRLLRASSDHYRALQQAAELAEREAQGNRQNLAGFVEILDPAHKERLLKAADSTFRPFLQDQLLDYFGQLDTALMIEAERQKTQAAQQHFLDAVALLRKQRQRVLAAVVSRISEATMEVLSGTPAANQQIAREPAASSTLELVEKEDFEDWLVVRVAVSRTDSRVRELMIELQLRLDTAFAGKSGGRLFNPFSPAALCHTLFEVIRPLGLKNPVLEVVFRVLQTAVLDRLPDVYHALNQLFAAARVLPDLDVHQHLVNQARSAAASADRPAPTPGPTPAQPLADTAAVTAAPPVAPVASAYQTVSHLRTLQRQVNTESPAPNIDAAPSAEPQVSAATLQALGLLKAQLAAASAQEQVTPLTQQLVAASPAPLSLNEREQDAVTMIEGLFQSLAQSDRVSDDLQADLHSLKVPLLRILLTDPELFNAPGHPARQSMNHLAMLMDPDSINLNANRPAIRQSIHDILSHEDDIAGFVAALPTLENMVLREQRITDRNRQRIREKCDGQQRLVQATRQVERELTQMLDRSVPGVIVDIVEQGWRELLRLTCLRHGFESAEFNTSLAVLRNLLEHAESARSTTGELAGTAEALIGQLAAGLARVSQGSQSRDSLIAATRALLLQGITENTPMAHYTGAELDEATLELRLATQTDISPNHLRWLKRARSLEPGQWFESAGDDHSVKRVQLLWMADDASQFMFVNRQGTSSMELPLDEVATRLRDGRLDPLGEGALPAVDEGLDALIQKMYDQLAFDSSHDQLTGLLTRKEFSRCLTQSVARAREQHLSYTLIFIDIQQFKVINNTCGYEAGDRYLRELSERLKAVAETGVQAPADAATGSQTSIGRVGADQFALLLPLPADSLGYRLAVEIKSAIEDNRFVENGHSFVIHAAIAMLGFDQRNQKVMELLRTVESASELSKRAGAKDIQVVRPGDGRLEELDEVMTWVTRINRALDEDNLKLRCQMIAPLNNDDGLGLPHYEVLLTVIDEQGEHMPPAGFIKAAEDYNRMGSVDRWVIETVLRWMMQHPDQLKLTGGFSINLSGHSMNDETFLDFIFEALVRYQVPRDKLIFEITETTAVANLEDAADFIAEMRSIGCRFSLDDFGVGQSSYSYLKRLPVDFIKIDGTFIREITTSDVDFALVRSITEMGHYLHKQVVAEYVTNAEILAVVTGIGVDYAQGHVHGLPVLLEHLHIGEAATVSPGA